MLNDINRLSNKQFFTPNLPFQIYRRTQIEPYPLHWHEFYELTFIISGEGIHKVNGVESKTGAGDLWLLTPADFHEIGPVPGGRLDKFNLIFTDKFLSDELRTLLFENVQGFTVASFGNEAARRIEADLAWILEEQQLEQLATELMVKATLERLLIGLIRASANRPAFSAALELVQESIQRAIAYIHHHFREPLDLDMVAAEVGLSPSYFSTCFHKAVGVTFRQYILQLRLHLASSLFLAGKSSVTEVCFACGFNTLNYFEKTFRKEYEMSPREYIKNKSSS
jgi:AraC-like DNA-binding protein